MARTKSWLSRALRRRSFQRVIDGFMAQTGDPTGTGRGGSQELEGEFSKAPMTRTVSRLRKSSDSADSQFFIYADDAVPGRKTRSGTCHRRNGERRQISARAVKDPDKIISMRAGTANQEDVVATRRRN
jgi:peptidylprolyl isomerase